MSIAPIPRISEPITDWIRVFRTISGSPAPMKYAARTL